MMVKNLYVQAREGLERQRLVLLPYVFVFPMVLMIVLIFLYPVYRGVVLSFYKEERFVGFSNYIEMFNNPPFWDSLLITLYYVFLYTLGVFFVGFFTALVLRNAETTNAKGQRIAGTIIMLPYAIPDVVASLVWFVMFDPQYGVLNYFLSLLGLGPVKWLISADSALYSVIVATVWRLFPVHCMIILAAFRAVPKELYEAAEIDGATGFRKFVNITLPYIQNIIGLLMVLTIVWSFKRFTILWLLTGGGPGRATETLVIQIYRNAFKFFRENYASALGTVGLVIVVLITILYFGWMAKEEERGEF